MRRLSLMMGATMLAVLGLVACGNSDDNQPANEVHNHAPATLTLDNGRKWQADQHTREGILGIRQALADKPAESLNDMSALGQDLQQRVKRLVSGCTMTGAAHNQLHVFLEGFMPAVDSLAGAKDEAGARETLTELHHMLEQYDDYFE
ncbi:MAG: hypothetical protein KDB90_11465 [Planctomycetes bacterium]|nr:hypothetical protein [Planctomycetota bacterium]